MKKYFGTDGIRGVANEFLTPELAFRLGRVLGNKAIKESGMKRPYIYIAKDSRINSSMLEYSVISGFLSSGVDVKRLHLAPTPAVAYLTKSTEASMGIMVSASHNPYYDNGIKIFGSDGLKLRDEEELEIERSIEENHVSRAINEDVGIVLNRHESIYQYIESLFFSVESRLEGLRIGLDCANGSTSDIAKRLFVRLGAYVEVINDKPNGININDKCGATDVAELSRLVVESKLDYGFAFDGDGDRVIAVDSLGRTVDGDHMILLFAKHLMGVKGLNNDKVSTTVMSNMGLFVALEKIGVGVNITDVGDRYVLANMIDEGLNIGGEQSGHVILLDYNNCGDGMLNALQIASVLKNLNMSMDDLYELLVKYPQKLGKIKVKDKLKVMTDESLLKEIERANLELGKSGRVLIRASGTEPVIRVMVEAKDDVTCTKYYDEFYDKVNKIA